MIAILGGLAAALSWAIATLVSSRSSRMIGPMSVLGWVMVVGLVVAIVPALLAGPVELGTPELAGLVVVGLSHNFGLLLAYKALSIGRVSIVAPIVATEGALAAVLSVVFGEPLTGAMAFLLGAISVGVVLAAVERSADPATPSAAAPEATRRAALFAVAAALTFSVGLLVAGRLGQEGMPPAWVMLASRTIGVLIIALPLVLTRRFRLTRAAAPLVAVAGVLEVFGGAIYVVAASAPGGVAVAAVLSSQFAAIAAVVAFFLFRERLQRIQVIGVAIIAIGITVLAAIQS